VFLVALPFSKLLHMPAVFVTSAEQPVIGRKLRLVLVGVIGAMLLVPAGLATRDIMQEGWTRAQPDFAKLAKVHKNLDQTVMVRNHPSFLTHSRSMVVYQGKRVAGDTIEKCVACHAVKDADGMAVGYDSPDHFCRGCHYKAAVSIDCFECHNSKPPSEKQAAIMPLMTATRTVQTAASHLTSAPDRSPNQ
jgi:hypothetical protein